MITDENGQIRMLKCSELLEKRIKEMMEKNETFTLKDLETDALNRQPHRMENNLGNRAHTPSLVYNLKLKINNNFRIYRLNLDRSATFLKEFKDKFSAETFCREGHLHNLCFQEEHLWMDNGMRFTRSKDVKSLIIVSENYFAVYSYLEN